MRLLIATLSLLVSTVAIAKPVYLHSMMSAYPGNRLEYTCGTCHHGGKPLTPYGRDFAAFKARIGWNNLKQVFAELGKIDSDGDGYTNDEEILANRHPGRKGE